MGDTTHIAWCDATQNFWWGCTKVSPGCKFCYADTFAKRTGRDIWGPTAPRWRTGPANWRKPFKWEREAESDSVRRRRRVFAQSMSDTFEDHPDANAWRPDIWPIIEATPHLDWLLLTKRPENINDMVPAAWRTAGRWPRNVWAGTSVESQEYAERRIPALLSVPASVRFLSCEPLLGPLDLRPWLGGLHWVIVGGESGAHHRPMDIEWARSIRAQCAEAGVAFFMKQPAHRLPGQFALLPTDLQIQAFPGA